MGSGFYLEVSLAPPAEVQADPAKQKAAEIAGITAARERPEDKQHTIYECYSDLDPRRMACGSPGPSPAAISPIASRSTATAGASSRSAAIGGRR
ncbi:MAG TPA: hypothetical protein VLX85_13460 [Stellaceae bacterium]|nr:hypothetical protein [Stellaceae bacterium]